MEDCVLCKKPLAEGANATNKAIGWLDGNDPWPLSQTGRACDKCNDSRVITARIAGLRPKEA